MDQKSKTCADCGAPTSLLFKYYDKCLKIRQLRLYEDIQRERDRHVMSMNQYRESLLTKHKEGDGPPRSEWHKWVYGGSGNPKL